MVTETFVPSPPESMSAPESSREKDPASVGLRRILRRSAVESIGGALHVHTLEHFASREEKKIAAAGSELQIIRLEQTVEALREEISVKAGIARNAVARAYAGGYAAGRERGTADSSAAGEEKYALRIADLQERIAAVLNAVEAEKKSYLASMGPLLLELTFRMARKVIGAEPALRDDAVLPVLKKTLAAIAERESLVVRVAPEDYPAVAENHEFWAPVGERLKGISIEKDARIKKGGCIIESAGGIVDARPEVQMSELEAIVNKAWDATMQDIKRDTIKEM